MASAQPQGVPVSADPGCRRQPARRQDAGGEQKVALANNVAVWGLEKARGRTWRRARSSPSAPTPQADGSQKAIRVIIFAEPMRGNGEGHGRATRRNTP